ncbi:MAG: phosphoribosylglycinamide formyltransferase [Vibrio sp.]
MSLLLRTTALMLLILSRAPAFAAPMPIDTSIEDSRSGESQSEISSEVFKHSLSGLYGIQPISSTPLQPYRDFDVLYSKAHQAQYELTNLCKETAMLTGTTPYTCGVKSRQRAQEKILADFSGQNERITDLARATIVANDVPSLVKAYEMLNRSATIVKVKNRFKNPTHSGYRDLNVLVELPKTKMIAEVQFHLAGIEKVKSGAEHAIYENIQAIERTAAMQQRGLSAIETVKIEQLRAQAKNLYQNAWHPYITTQLQAA